ncbi:MAG TPA: WD40 repeat domain-containing protein [Elusimicrobiota bacterium]|nr:WD40 repeat domain-containing protein [Elusimicrobiota bacterium]
MNGKKAAVPAMVVSFALCFPGLARSGVSTGTVTVTLARTQKFPEPVTYCRLNMDSRGNIYPNVLATKDSIEILDPAGNVKVSFPNHNDPEREIATTIFSADDGNHVAVLVQDESRRTHGEYDIFDENGNRTLQIKPFDDDASGPHPSPSGDYAVGWWGADMPAGPPIFYDASGYRNKWATVVHGAWGKTWPTGYGAADVSFSPSGSQAIVIATKGTSSLTLAYDAQGNPLWSAPNGSRGVFSPDGQEIAQGYIDYNQPTFNGVVRILSAATGKILWQDELAERGNVYQFKFFSDGKQLIAASAHGDVYLFNASNGNTVWHWNTQLYPGVPKGFEMEGLWTFAATANLNTLAIATNSVKTNSGPNPTAGDDYLIFLSGQGNIISGVTLPPDSFALVGNNCVLSFSASGKNLLVLTRDGLRTYQINGN